MSMILFTCFQCTTCRLLYFVQVQVTHCTEPVHKANWYTEHMSSLQSILHAAQYTHEANADYRLYCKLHSIHMKHMQCTHEANAGYTAKVGYTKVQMILWVLQVLQFIISHWMCMSCLAWQVPSWAGSSKQSCNPHVHCPPGQADKQHQPNNKQHVSQCGYIPVTASSKS